MPADQFYSHLANAKHLPTTSQPSLGSFVEKFEKLKSRGFTHVLGLFLTRKFSGTVQNAAIAAKMVPGLQTEMLDSQTVTWGLGMLVLQAQQLILSGLPFTRIVENIRERRLHTAVVFSVDSLDALQRGGRIGKAAAFLGKAFGIRPVLWLPGATGEIEVVGKVNSHPAAVKAVVAQAQKHVRLHGLENGITVIQSARPERASELLSALQASGEDWKNIGTGRIGAVIGTHLGPDGWGVALC